MNNQDHPNLRHPAEPSELRGRAERDRKRWGPTAFDDEIARLWERGDVAGALRRWCGKDPRGEAYYHELVHFLRHVHIDDGRMSERPLRRLESRDAEQLARVHLTLSGLLRRRGSEIRIDGAAGFWGRQYLRTGINERPRRVGKRAGHLEVRWRRAEGKPRLYKLRVKPAPRPRCPKGQSGGLADRWGVCRDQVRKYARAWRVGGLFGSQQPPRDSRDAVMPREGQYPYAIWRPLRALPPAAMRKLQEFWGELTSAEKARAPASRRKVSESEREAKRGARAASEALPRGSGPPADRTASRPWRV